MKYYISKILMLVAFVVATVCYFEKVFEVANYFMLGAILFQLISMEKKDKEITTHVTVNNQSESKQIAEQIANNIMKNLKGQGRSGQ